MSGRLQRLGDEALAALVRGTFALVRALGPDRESADLVHFWKKVSA